MPMTNEQMLQKVTAAVKAINTDDLGDSKLPQEKRDKFVQVLSEGTRVLDNARQVDMNSDQYDIDRITFADGILKKASEGQGVNDSDKSKPDFATNKLKAKEGIAVVELTYSTLEDNIEKENFEDSLLELIADRAGTDLEISFITGKEDDDSNSIDALTDGWLEKAEYEVNGLENEDFDQGEVTDMFDAMIDKIDEKYLRDEDEWVFYVSRDVQKAYRNHLKNRGTQLGDAATTEGNSLKYEGIDVVRVPGMPSGHAVISHEENFVYGVHRDVTIESDKDIEKRKVKFVLSLRMDCHFEDENAAVVGKNFKA